MVTLRGMVVRVVLALVLALAAPAVAQGAANYRIVGGQPVTTTDLPYVVGLEIAIDGVGNDDPDALCAGSLIAARWVLTAAHCLVEEDVDVANSRAVIGATNLNAATADQRFGWAAAIVSPGYASGGGGFDVGLIRLARPAPGPQLRLLRASETGLFTPGTRALTAGWGYTEDPQDGGTLSTGQLRAVELDIVSDLDCESSFARAGQGGLLRFETEVCAIAENKDSCNGDSGGPLMVGDGGGLPALVGAVSFGIGSGSILRGNRSCNEGPPGVYSKVGADPLNAFVRRHVPQVEISANVAQPVPGQMVTFTAVGNAPGRSGPFGGYDALSWDLDGDGSFGERPEERSVQVRVRKPFTTLAVRATTTAGDAEVRTARIVPQDKSAVSFSRSTARVRRGRTATIRIARTGNGAGSATVRLSGSGVTPRRRVVRFTGTERARLLRVQVGRRGRPRTVTLRLGSFTGDLVPGVRTRLRLRVRR